MPLKGNDVTEKSATPWGWRSSTSGPGFGGFPEELLLARTEAVARGLLGCRLRSTVGGVEVEGVIIETEAYVGPHDPASHAATRIGRTRRNAAMFGPAGHAYVYRSHGIHWCFNVVTEEVGFPAAVLVRALDPTGGIQHMRDRRLGRTPLCSGPGRLCQALGVSGALDSHCLRSGPLSLEEGWSVADEAVGVSGRIGIRQARDWPLRFFLRGHPEVSGRKTIHERPE